MVATSALELGVDYANHLLLWLAIQPGSVCATGRVRVRVHTLEVGS